jgi:hypothetical protein
MVSPAREVKFNANDVHRAPLFKRTKRDLLVDIPLFAGKAQAGNA